MKNYHILPTHVLGGIASHLYKTDQKVNPFVAVPALTVQQAFEAWVSVTYEVENKDLFEAFKTKPIGELTEWMQQHCPSVSLAQCLSVYSVIVLACEKD